MENENNNIPMIEKILNKKTIKITALAAVILFLAILSVNIFINEYSKGYIYESVDSIPYAQAVLILGASVYSDGRLSDILKDRVITAINLYQKGKAEKILISGYGKGKNYNEVDSIKAYIVDQGIPEYAILSDYSGDDTYDSLYRAKNISKLESINIATQNYHLPRAVYIARRLGMEASGISSDLQTYQRISFFKLREEFASLKAVFDILLQAKPDKAGI
jgi:SanA protein